MMAREWRLNLLRVGLLIAIYWAVRIATTGLIVVLR